MPRSGTFGTPNPNSPVVTRSGVFFRNSSSSGVSSGNKPKNTKKETVEETPKNLAEIKHNPGEISQENIRNRQTNKSRVEDVIEGKVVGYNSRNSSVIVRDNKSTNYEVPTTTDAKFSSNQTVLVNRSRSQNGERSLRVSSFVTKNKLPSDPSSSFSGQTNNNDLCIPSNNSPPNPPNPPDGEDPEDPPDQPDRGEIPPDDDDQNPPNPPGKPFGCKPNDDAQWFNDSCPPGTEELGFAELSSGTVMKLCRDPSGNTPPGDGCPDVPDEYGWSCFSGECTEVPNGTYTTRGECESSGCGDTECNEWGLVDGVCSFIPNCGGTYKSLSDCQDDNPPAPPPFDGKGQCPGVQYRLTYTARSETYNNASCSSTTVFTGSPTTRTLTGPLSNLRLEFEVDGICGPRRVRRLITANGVDVVLSQSGLASFGRLVSGHDTFDVTIERIDGQPDNCG